MTRLYLIVIVALAGFFGFDANAVSFQNETLRYVVTYKWGLIHKDAGEATLTLRKTGDKYHLTMYARSKPWADRIYRVRDTLRSTLRVSDFRPVKYEKRMHEKDRVEVEEVSFVNSGNVTNGKGVRHKTRKGNTTVQETALSATGPVYDFLSIFYYIRRLDYSKLNRYKSYTATVFSGTKKETVKIKSLGLTKIKMRDKSEREAYHIKFNFTQEGGKKSSDDIDAYISTDSGHVPLYVVGKLPVGEIRVYLR